MSACRTPHRPAPRRRASMLAIGSVAAALMLSACTSGGTSGGSADTKFVAGTSGVETVRTADREAAPALEGTTLAGDPLTVSDFRGKVVVLNVWGSWCNPCRAEAPNLVKVAAETKDDVQFVGLNARDPNKANAVKFEKEFEVNYPSLYDPKGKLMLRFPKGSLNPQSIPSTIVLDRKGRIAARALMPLTEDQLREMVDPLIAEK